MVAANGVYKLAVIGTVLGQQHVHTIHFRSTASGNSVGFSEAAWQQDLIDTWQAGCRTTYRLLFNSSDRPCELYQVRKVCGSQPLPGGVDEGEQAPNIVGSSVLKTGEASAPWLAAVVTTRTDFAGRRYRGRFFLGGLWESDFSGDSLASQAVTAITAYANALKTTYVDPLETGVNAKFFVFSRLLSQMEGVACQNAGADIKSFSVQPKLATMKSRKVGSGR
jgi:hypothetical protein